MPATSARSAFLRSATAAALIIGSSTAMAQAPTGGEHGGEGAGAGGTRGGVANGGMSPGAGGADRAAPGAGGAGRMAPGSERSRSGAAEQGGEKTQHDGGGSARDGRPGAGGAEGRGGHAHLGSEQRTRFRNVVREHHVEPLHGVDFAVRAGSIVPERYHFYALPPELIDLVPEYRGYDYVVVDDKIIILEPGTRRIVDIIEE